MITYFDKTIKTIEKSLASIEKSIFFNLVDTACEVVKNGNKIVLSGLGKNVPICDKIVGSLLSLGIDANVLHTNSAIHGDMGMIKDGDLVVILSKSGNTTESVQLVNLLLDRNIHLFGLTFNKDGKIVEQITPDNCVALSLDEEGDPWNIMPNNSSTINLIVLQAFVMELVDRLDIELESFKQNHPGGAIGEKLRNEKN